MNSPYYKSSYELETCNELIDKYFKKGFYEACFEGYLKLAKETSFPPAMCQVGYFYLEGIGCHKSIERAMYWLMKAAELYDPDAMFLMGLIYEHGFSGFDDKPKAAYWYKEAALKGQNEACKKCQELGIMMEINNYTN